MKLKIKKNILLASIILVYASCIKPSTYKSDDIKYLYNEPVYVRILIYEGKKPVSISSENDFIIKDNISAAKKISGKKAISINLDDIIIPIQVISEKELLKLNGIPYRGTLEIIKSGGILFAVNHLSIEEYLLSVVAGEIPASWPAEALKAQAVASRTYAYNHILNLKNKKTLYDLKATTSSQVYKGALAEKVETSNAVKGTAGVIITYNNYPIISFFHSSCGGKTADYKTVWNMKNLDYLEQVECDYCSESPDYKWETSISIEEIKTKIKKLYRFNGRITGIIFERESERISEVTIKHDKGIISISGNKFRLLFGPKKIKSLNFVTKKIESEIRLNGKGWGHGVGLCQWGAKGLSLKGYEYKNILKYYFKNIDFSNIQRGVAFN